MRNNFKRIIAGEDLVDPVPLAEEQTVSLNEADKKTDLIVMSGPLSQVFTQALGVYFAKRDIVEEEPDGGEVAKESYAKESQANDALMSSVISEVAANQDSLQQTPSHLVIVNQYDDFDEAPDANVIVVPATDVGTPETIEQITAVATVDQKLDRDTVLMVATQKAGFSQVQNTTDYEYVDIVRDEGVYKTAVENLYRNVKGLQVVIGVKGFSAWANTRQKK